MEALEHAREEPLAALSIAPSARYYATRDRITSGCERASDWSIRQVLQLACGTILITPTTVVPATR